MVSFSKVFILAILLLAFLPGNGQQSDTLKLSPYSSISYTSLGKEFTPWMEIRTGLTLAKEDKFKLQPSVNCLRRFDQSGVQFQMDSYWFFGKKWYANILLSAGNGTFLPSVTYGFELYKTVRSFELSTGIRQMKFTQPVTIYSSSLGNYAGNYWYSLRVQYARQSMSPLNGFHYAFTSRRYLRSGRQYIEARAGYGKRIDILTEADRVQQIQLMNFGIGYTHPLNDNRQVGFKTTYYREIIREGYLRNRFQIAIYFQ